MNLKNRLSLVFEKNGKKMNNLQYSYNKTLSIFREVETEGGFFKSD